jgi:hypothetical protein
MKKGMTLLGFILCMLVAWPNAARAQGGFEPVSADAFTRAVPADFYLEGNRIPVEKRNTAVLKNANGARMVIGLIDTTGYSTQIKQKYIGMLITEMPISVCGIAVGVGSYGFGLDRPAPTSTADAPFKVYNQAGEKLGECAAKKDDSIKQAKPLATITPQGGPAKVYLGKYVIEIR